MSASNRNGRALEFAYLIVFEKHLSATRKIAIEQNSSYFASKSAWDSVDVKMQETFIKSATAGMKAVLEAEPLIEENTGDSLVMKIQPDKAGKEGDVRDILVIRSDIGWEIGLSVKNNHDAVKHSRLSQKLDFGDKWYGMKCSDKYWSDIKPIFDYLTEQKKKGFAWSDLPSKDNDVYIPLLTAFLDEVKRSYATEGEAVPRNMVEYLIGKYDFYKAKGENRKKLTRVQPYNLHGTLGKPSSTKQSKYVIPILPLPTRIFHAAFKPGSTTTVEICMDEGWHFGFRIHNAATLVEASLKFDV
ncbi:MAG: HaeIII family restriction endonuclease [Defluviitaleaceae bacterium]|nr:HaeIII family restriction endonuclease [Defluviitaleaceae bacterium]